VAADVPEVLVGDAGRLRQVIVNLVGNAIKFTERGEVVVSVSRMKDGGWRMEDGGSKPGDPRSSILHPPSLNEILVGFEVRDTGIGIPRDKLESIFRPFEQADGSTTRRYGGTGLGLSIATRLVELMGGRLWVESEPGRGSTFHFVVRLGLGQAPAGRPPRAAPERLLGLPVLVVDDNATNRRVLEEFVRGWRMVPVAVDGGEEALRQMRAAADRGQPFALVLLDAMMPQVDGFDVARRIKEEPSLAGATLLMLSSADQGGDATRCRDLGVRRYLVKPIKQSDLLDTIVTLLAEGPATGPPHPPPASAAATEVQAAVPPGRALRVLLAEDNAVNQRLAVRLLQKAGHSVVVAGNGAEALAALEREPFDVVLMDVQMPQMDGFEATAAVRAREAGTGRRQPIVAMTAHAMKGDRERCLEAGMDGYVSKPIQGEQLWAAIDEVLGARGPQPADFARD
jgi:CheY-like chemotaxis protein